MGKPAEQKATTGAEVADKRENAASQSSPAAKQVLDAAADEARQQPSMAPVDRPGSFAQDAMEKAGKAEATGAAAGR